MYSGRAIINAGLVKIRKNYNANLACFSILSQHSNVLTKNKMIQIGWQINFRKRSQEIATATKTESAFN
jgi:hypothetical protein